jgi:pimeloyl-ACP methyl ester carboxylesterase
MWPVRSASGSRRLDSRALMRSFGIERAHLVGHSSGGASAMQLALDAPDAVQ